MDCCNTKISMSIEEDSDFAKTINKIIVEKKPQYIIETGTFLGKGTTSAICSALKSINLKNYFISIEVNPIFYREALFNLYEYRDYVSVINGLSIPKSLLPKIDEIKTKIYNSSSYRCPVDCDEESYFKETNYNVPDDILGKTLTKWDGKCDFILLDSAGHVGNIEFKYVLDKIKTDCYFMLDDTIHIKHYMSFAMMSKDKRFEIIKSSSEKAGFCVAKFSPKK